MSSDEIMNIIEKITEKSGAAKKRYLTEMSSTEGLAEVLLAAYDPHKKYFTTRCNIGWGDNEFTELTWKILDQLSTRELSGMDAQAVVEVHTENLTTLSSALFKRILNKDLRFGMRAKTINTVFPNLIPVHDVMLAKLYDKSKLRLPCFGSPKIDGVRADYKDGKIYSRGGFEYTGLSHLTEALKPFGHDLTGELTTPGLTFQQSSGQIRSLSNSPDAVFHLLDVPSLDRPFKDRLITMDDLHLITNYILKVEHNVLRSKEEVADYYTTCRKMGLEGAVVKPFDYKYNGTRSYNWMKVKPVDSVDLKVIGVFEGKGKYEGQMGGVIVEYKGQRNKVGGGWTDAQRAYCYKYPGKIVGTTIEVFFMEETDEGNMRHARFIRFRGDKD